MEKNVGARIVNLAMMKTVYCVAFALSFGSYVTNAADPSPLQDFCVGVNDYKSSVFVNGKFCKNPNDVTMKDFVYSGFDVPGNTSGNSLRSTALLISDAYFPAVNTLGIAIGRIDFGLFGLNTPHLHPLGSEIFVVMEGTLYVGFVTTDNKLFDAVVKKGDLIVFPQGLVHFQLNIGKTHALAIAGFGSQNPGRVNIANALFGSAPPIFSEVLTKAFQVSDRVIQKLQSQFATDDDDNDDDFTVETGRSLLKLMSEAAS